MITKAVEAKEKGNVAFKASDYNLAIANYTVAIQLDPSEFTYPLNRCMTYLKMEKWKEAEKDGTTTLNLSPNLPKALYRRGLARKGLKKWKSAREDFEAAMKGGAVEAEQELNSIPPSSKSTSSPSTKIATPPTTTSKTKTTPILLPAPTESSTEVPPTASTIPSSRLRAAITPTSNSTTESGFMKEVSSRKLSNGKSNSFADKKESRDTRLSSSAIGIVKPVTKVVEIEKSIPIVEVQPTISTPSPSIPTLISPSIIIPQVVQKPLSSITPTFQAHVVPLKVPTTALAFESAFTSSTSSRLSLLKSLDPSTLHTLFKTNLSPDLLSEIVQELTSSASDDLRWVMSFLVGLTSVPRFTTVVGFLDENEKNALKEVFENSRKELNVLEGKWEL